MDGDDEKKKEKSDYAEVEFEIGNIEFEAKGRSIVVERMFKLLLEKIEQGSLVATLQLEDFEEDEDEEDEIEFEDEEEELIDETDDFSEFEKVKEDVHEVLEDTLKEIDKAIPNSEERKEDSGIPSEAYLDPPPAWDSLDEESPPESTAEKDELGTD